MYFIFCDIGNRCKFKNYMYNVKLKGYLYVFVKKNLKNEQKGFVIF